MTVEQLRTLLDGIEGRAEVRIIRKDNDAPEYKWGAVEGVTYWRDMQCGDSAVYLAARD